MKAKINENAGISTGDSAAWAANLQPLSRNFNASSPKDSPVLDGADAEYRKFAAMNLDWSL